MKSRAWAVIDNDQIDIATVSPTWRGAVVNWLVGSAGIMIWNCMRDQKIRDLWEQQKGTAECVAVDVTEIQYGRQADDVE